jgi:threonine/homoserine/homoserine lactone efflux protein
MSNELITAFILFAFVSSVTPGPNNLMLMASGANFGIRRTVPHMLGIGIGFTFMIVLVGIGLVQVFNLYPVSYTILKVVSVVYLCWLAWKIANANAPQGRQATGKPITFLQAAAFQWVNPKAWAMAVTATTVYAPGQHWQTILFVAAVFGLVNLPSVSIWTVLGQQIRRILTNATRLRVFNWSMAALLVASLYPVIFTNAG